MPTPPAERTDWLAAVDPATLARWVERYDTPLYLYDADVIRARIEALRGAFPGWTVRYAMKANANPAVLATVLTAGLEIDAVSPGEVQLARAVGFKRRAIAYSGHGPSTRELQEIHACGVTPDLDSRSALSRWCTLARGSTVSLRVNLDVGAGHHPHVVTAGPESKFGLAREDLPEVLRIAKAHDVRVTGVHQHIGSGLLDTDRATALAAMDALLDVARTLPDLEEVNVGGGFGVPYTPEEITLDLAAWGREMTARIAAFERTTKRTVRRVIEPGRYVIAESGVLVARVTDVKRGHDRVFVTVDTGMHHLVRPAMYGAWHPVRTVPERSGAPERCTVVGPICESGDVLADARMMPVPEEGDLLVVGVAGAYGYAMASQYNLRGRPAEVLVEAGHARKVRSREHFEDVVRTTDLARARRKA